MVKNSEASQNAQHQKVPLKFIIEGKEYETCEQYKKGAELKQLAGIPLEAELFLSISKPYNDELIENDTRVNLARPDTEYFFVKKKLYFTINGVQYIWYKQYIRGIQIRELGKISPDDEIYLDLPDGWKDDFIKDDEVVDLARPGVEHFVSKPPCYTIIVNGREREWHKRKISFAEIVATAFPNVNYDSTAYTVLYSNGHKENPKGSMVKGDVICVTNKMIFNVTATNKS